MVVVVGWRDAEAMRGDTVDASSIRADAVAAAE